MGERGGVRGDNGNNIYVDFSPEFLYSNNNSDTVTRTYNGRLAQLVRAPVSHTGGRWFESITAYHELRGYIDKV